jgi:hypothetical protein
MLKKCNKFIFMRKFKAIINKYIDKLHKRNKIWLPIIHYYLDLHQLNNSNNITRK